MRNLISKLIFLGIIFSINIELKAAETCRAIISNSAASDPTLFLDIKNFLNNNSTASIYKRVRPDWNHYNEVQTLVLRLEKVKLTAEEREALKNLVTEKSKEFQDLIQLIQIKLIEGQSAKFVNPIERFLDYNIAYFRLLNKLNSLSGIKIIPLPVLKDLPSDRKLKQEAEALVRKLEKEVEDKFTNISQFGFKNIEEFNEFTKKESQRSAKLLDLTQKNLVVAMHRPESARFWIPLAGFQNQRVTQSSRGSLYNDSDSLNNMSGRDRAEANLTLSTFEEYIPKSARFKPNYAEARPDHLQNEFKPHNNAYQYGTDLWIIKDDVINRRSTWTPVDSLSAGMYTQNSNSGYDDVFIPWKFRSLIVPYVNGNDSFTPYGLNSSFNFKARRWSDGSSYIEVQIFGPLNINDVKAFHFQRTPPDRAFYELLKSKNIEVMDERTWPPKPYNGEESL